MHLLDGTPGAAEMTDKDKEDCIRGLAYCLIGLAFAAILLTWATSSGAL
jgi:hypothetical protein